MAKFAAIVKYTEDEARVTEIRPQHREYLSGLLESGKMHQSGPFPDRSGALIIYNAEDLAEAQVLLANDPFSVNGIIVSAELKEWVIVFDSTNK